MKKKILCFMLLSIGVLFLHQVNGCFAQEQLQDELGLKEKDANEGSENIKKSKNLGQLRAEIFANEENRIFLQHVEEQKQKCRDKYDDFDVVFALGLESMHLDKAYQDVFEEKMRSDEMFNIAEFIYEIGTMHPDYHEY